MELEAELDRLYQAPASEFVTARNQLSRSLKQAGQTTEASRIAKLPRPTPVAWVLNQLHFRERDALETLLESGAALRKAQEALATPEHFADCKRLHAQALRTVTELALGIAAKAEMAVNAGLRRRIELGLTLLSGSAGGELPPPGRISVEPEPAGFDAFAASVLPEKPAPRDDSARKDAVAAATRAIAAIEGEVKRLQEVSRDAHEKLEKAASDAAEAEKVAETARQVRDAARREAEAAKTELDEVSGELARHKRALAESG